MADKPLDVYLNDHLAGATFGSDLARQLARRAAGGDAERALREVADEIEADHRTLCRVMELVQTTVNPVKRATTWVGEKLSRLKLTGLTAGGEGELGLFLALETLSLGVEGKAALWTSLQQVGDRYPALRGIDFADLVGRAERQRAVLERERDLAAARAFTGRAGA